MISFNRTGICMDRFEESEIEGDIDVFKRYYKEAIQ